MYDSEKFEREVKYDSWVWSDYSIFDKIEWPEDYHILENKNILGTDIIEFCNRFYFKKVDYYPTENNMLYETFGLVDETKLENDIFPIFHFQQKTQCQNSIHSRCGQNATCILKLKSDNVRRDYWYNTSFIINGNLNKQLENLEVDPETSINQDFIFYSLFGWQEETFIENQYLKRLMDSSEKKFLLQKRRLSQGIAKTFTLYF